jgi:hypothetical protein
LDAKVNNFCLKSVGGTSLFSKLFDFEMIMKKRVLARGKKGNKKAAP